MNYDDWKTTPPDEEDEPLEVEETDQWDMEDNFPEDDTNDESKTDKPGS